MVSGDAGRVAMRAGAASAAATVGRMEAIDSGCGLETGGCKDPVVIRRPGEPTWLAAVCGQGVGLRSALVGWGLAGLLPFFECMRISFHKGEQFPWGAFGCGGGGHKVSGPCAVGSLGRRVRWACCGAWGSL